MRAEANRIPRGKWIEAPVPRIEGARVLLGDARYVADIQLPRMQHAASVRSPHAHARILSIDTNAALAIEGVSAVYEAAELPTRTWWM